MNPKRLDNILVAIITAITVIGAVVWDVYTPYSTDDHFYREVMRPDFCPTDDAWPGSGEEIENVEQAWRSVKNHYVYNGRLANFTHIFMQVAGRTAQSVILGLCIGVLAVLTLACVRRFSGRLTPLAVVAATVLFWCALPWHDTFQSLDFQCNYVLPSLVIVVLMLLLSRMEGMGLAAKTGVAALALICSWLHEGFGCVALVFFAATALFPFGNHRPKDSLIICVAMLVGLGVNLACGTANRIADSAERWPFTTQILVQIGLDLWPLALTVVAVALSVWNSRGKERAALVGILLPLLCGAVAGLFLALFFRRGMRMLWPCDLFCIVALGIIANRVSWRAARRAQTVAAIIFIAIYGWWMTQQCLWNKQVGDDSRRIEAIHGAGNFSAPTVFFFDYTAGSDLPWWLLRLTQQPLDNSWNSECYGSHLQDREGGSVLVLPPSLRGKTLEEWPKIEGRNNLRGVYPMMASRDSVELHGMIKFGRPGANISPVDRALRFLKSRGRVSAEDSIGANIFASRLIMPDGSIAYRYVSEELPRTLLGRPFMSLDSISVDPSDAGREPREDL